MTHKKGTDFEQEFVLVGGVQDIAAESAMAALDGAGIVYSADKGRGAVGFRVRKPDVARAIDVLKVDAQLHQYKVNF